MDVNNEKSNRLRLDYTGMMKNIFNPQGWTKEKLAAMQPQLTEAHNSLRIQREQGGLDFSKLLTEMECLLPSLVEYANELTCNFDNFVILGIGGSALGPLAIQQALNPYYYNELCLSQNPKRPRLYVVDNIDPDRFTDLLRVIDLEKTIFNVITKSGATSETMAQFMIIRDILRQNCGDDYTKHIVVTTDKEKGNLVPMIRAEGYRSWIIPAGIGGRFSELTPVGLLPAAVCGIDVYGLLQGALEMDKWIRESESVLTNPAQLSAVLSYLAWQEGKNISVFMPYADSLKTFSDWYAQLWAESLGKRVNRQGKEVFTGQTPVKALGVTDQHSQVQLYTEGPADKVVTFLTIEKFSSDCLIPYDKSLPDDIKFLGGHSLGELLQAEQNATEYALSLAKRQHRKIILPVLNACTVGQLLLLLMWETAYMGELLDINTFNQPGVEEGKIGTFALMGREGFETRKHEIEEYAKTFYVLE
ncbi:MAG: glucose-6-phosphate isomerase [Desulfitobacteriaceae bacterium]|nr:glucose-6-phosphate isomerase [Desulfitobacteriaceae bacterium]MDD4347128.1 glucose-6-phosphate isomerase [Desulfitobacteriaceae bacterium]MDD4400982.1 glucose-6-phosphate isomerase [Desulfitobacteriaceae bacterium]